MEHFEPSIAQVRAARGWINDCVWGDVEDADELTMAQVIRGIARHYSGGWVQFLADGEGYTP